MTLRRGLGEPVISWINSGKKKITDEGFSAFSYHDGVPTKYAQIVMGVDSVPEKHFYELKVKAGQRALFIGDANNHFDSEVLFARGTALYIIESKAISVNENGTNMRYVYHTVQLEET